MDDLLKYLEVLRQYSDNLLLVVVVLLWGVRRYLTTPLSRKLDAWEVKIEHYLTTHDEQLFSTGRIERLLKDIHGYIFRGDDK